MRQNNETAVDTAMMDYVVVSKNAIRLVKCESFEGKGEVCVTISLWRES